VTFYEESISPFLIRSPNILWVARPRLLVMYYVDGSMPLGGPLRSLIHMVTQENINCFLKAHAKCHCPYKLLQDKNI
jgi:hypothetical protein